MLNGSIERKGSGNDSRSLSLLHSSSVCIAWLTALITEPVAIVTLNVLTLIVFARNRSLRKRSMYLVINLAVADMLVGGFSEVVLFVDIGDMCSVWRYNDTSLGIWNNIIYSMQLMFPAASITNLAAISLERAHATFRPFKHRVIKNWVLGVVITVTWVTAGLFSTAIGLAFGHDRLHTNQLYIHCSFISSCLFIIFVSYTSIVVKVYCGAHPQHIGAASRERKLTKTLFIVTLVSLIIFLPGVVIRFSGSIPKVSIERFKGSFFVLYFAKLTPLLILFLYTIRMPEFRRALVSLFRRQHRQGPVQIPLRVRPCN